MSLIDKLRSSRRTPLTIGAYTFQISRPTDLEMALLGDKTTEHIFKKYVVDWNVKEIDIIPGGSPVVVPFDADLFYDWVSDHPDLWNPISDAIINSYKLHIEHREGSEKKLIAG